MGYRHAACLVARLRETARHLRALSLAVLLLTVTADGSALAKSLQVVTDIRPVQALIAALVEGTATEVRLLFQGGDDPHHVALRPSQMRHLVQADLVFIISREMTPPLDRLARSGRVNRLIELARADGLTLLPRRRLDPPGIQGPAPRGIDWHVWTDPQNVILMARAAARALAETDPAQAARHAANLSRLEATLRRADSDLDQRLSPLAGRAFLLVHDATQYLERRLGLKPLAVVQPDHETAPGPRRMAALQRLVQTHPGLCILSPPGGALRWARRLAEGGHVRVGVIDVLGIRLDAEAGGLEFWPTYFASLADTYETCLGPAPDKRP